MNLPAEAKSKVKTLVLSSLASPLKNVRKGAAQAVSAIASIELPRKEWRDVIGALAANAQGANQVYKIASLETLGYICEELPSKTLEEREVDIVLTAIVSNLMPQVTSDEVKMVASAALNHCLRFCEKNFKVESERTILFANIAAICQSTNEDIKKNGMKALQEVVKYFYEYIGGNTLEMLGHATFNAIKDKENEEAGLLALEVWSSICDEEITRLKKKDPKLPPGNYIQTAYSVLVPLLLESLKAVAEDEESDWDMSIASACCLSLVAEITKDVVVALVVDFVSKNIASADWKARKAAIMAFASVLKGPAQPTINTLVSQAVNTFVAILGDKKPQVRESAAWAFSRFVDNACDPLLHPQVFPVLVDAFIKSLKDTPKVSYHICFTLHNLASVLAPNESQNTSMLSGVFKEVLQALWENAFRPDAFSTSINLVHSSFVAFSDIVQYSAPDVIPMLEPVLKMLIETFASTVAGTFSNPAKSADFQGYLCTALYPVCMKLGTKVHAALAGQMVDLIIESFKMRGMVYDEGVQAFSGLLFGIGKELTVSMEKFMPYLIHSLKMYDDTTLCRAAVGCVGDLSRILEDKMVQYLGQIVPVLMDILKNPETDRTLKPNVISVLGDLAFSTGRNFNVYLHDLLEILKDAAGMSLQTQQEVPIVNE